LKRESEESGNLSSQDLLLPVYHTLTERELADVAAAVKKVVTNVSEPKKPKF